MLVRLPLVLALFALHAPAQVSPRSHLSQFGITWTFDKAYATGEFANGDR